MKPRSLLVLALALAACGLAYSQAPRPETGPPTIPSPNVPVSPRAEPPAADKTLDQLIDRLEALRGQKAELEKAEAELVKEIRRKLDKQGDRLSRLGLNTPDQVAPPVLTPSTSAAPPAFPAPAAPRN